MNNKALSSILATLLVLLLTIATFSIIYQWFSELESSFENGLIEEKNLELMEIRNGVLYVKNDNPSIMNYNLIKINGEDCSIAGELESYGYTQIDISSCIDETEISPKEIAIITEKNVYSRTLVPRVTYELCSNLPGEWVLVPGSSYFETNNFCVMKWEAKCNSANGICDNNNDIPQSIPDNEPWHTINFDNAFERCDALNTEHSDLSGTFRLITNREWMTIARNIENNPNNWNSSEVGVGWIPRGNSNTSASMDGTDPLSGIHYRILELTNGQEIWDFAGNVLQWVDANENGTAVPTGNACGSYGQFSFYGTVGSYTECNFIYNNPPYRKTSAPDVKFEIGPLGNYNQENGIGRVYSSSSGSLDRAIRRGGTYEANTFAGIYTILLTATTTTTYNYLGFRCTYTP